MSAEDKEQQLDRSEADSSATIAALEDGEKAKEEGVTPRDQDASAQHDNSVASATDDPATDVEKVPEAALDPSEEKDEYPRGIKLLMLLLSIYLAVFLVALDRTIIATALPQITNHFNSFADVGWVSSLSPSLKNTNIIRRSVQCGFLASDDRIAALFWENVHLLLT
jgi:hypothetical protein